MHSYFDIANLLTLRPTCRGESTRTPAKRKDFAPSID